MRKEVKNSRNCQYNVYETAVPKNMTNQDHHFIKIKLMRKKEKLNSGQLSNQ